MENKQQDTESSLSKKRTNQSVTETEESSQIAVDEKSKKPKPIFDLEREIKKISLLFKEDIETHKSASEWKLSSPDGIIFGIGSIWECFVEDIPEDEQKKDFNGDMIWKYRENAIPWFGILNSQGNPVYYLGEIRKWKDSSFGPFLSGLNVNFTKSYLPFCPKKNGYEFRNDYEVKFSDQKVQEKIWNAINNQDDLEKIFLNAKLDICCLKKNLFRLDNRENTPRLRGVQDCDPVAERKKVSNANLLWRYYD